MAKQLNKSGITTGQAITTSQISQSIDALTGVDAYDLTISGSLNLTGSVVTGSISNAVTASHAITASHALNASGGSTFPFTGSAAILGSLVLDGNVTSVTNITASGNISASGGNIMGDAFANNPPGVGVNQISVRVNNRIDLSPNNSVAIRLSDSLVSLNKDTSVNGDITSITNITASGNISSSGTITATSGSFSHLVGNSPITIGSSVNFSQPITASGNLITSGSQTRKIRTVTLTTKGTGTLNAAQSIQPDDDIILVVGNTTPTIGVNDFTFNCTDLFYAQASEVGRIVTIANVNSAVGTDLFLGAPNPGETTYTVNGATVDGRFGQVCTTIGDEVNIVVLGLRTVAIYGSGI